MKNTALKVFVYQDQLAYSVLTLTKIYVVTTNNKQQQQQPEIVLMSSSSKTHVERIHM